ncbi:type III-A CRISPR-associated RAMP protein Csm4 [Chloroflexus sp.]|uniref:type III-A CRISPR-associated RAMP protein Csm4 n=1 Tax=Chloroflexus sp. TaxID=1904827 RepID=UPI002623F00D|nr:type III-A CRISPR-associated RAMP protein Csm4 [uncultured Chloroflexus sp.]
MATFDVYYLNPPPGATTLAFHFGRQGIGLEETNETLASDSLFAALTAQAAVSDPARAPNGAPAWIAPFVAGQPPLRHSSLLPAIADLPLLPRPLLPLHLPEASVANAKQLKKLRYLSPLLFSLVCRGEPLPERIIILQQGKVWLSEDEADRLPSPWRLTNNEAREAWRARLQATPLWQIEAIPRVALDRLSNASAYYEVGRVVFTPGAGLCLLVSVADPSARAPFERLLTLLGESGLGGKRANGYGTFGWRRGQPLKLTMAATPRRAVLLSRFVPADDRELALVRDARSTYQIVNVGGWSLTTDGVTLRRSSIMMLSEGSVIAVNDRLPEGKLIDVRPDETITHPIYRSGLALAIGIPG